MCRMQDYIVLLIVMICLMKVLAVIIELRFKGLYRYVKFRTLLVLKHLLYLVGRVSFSPLLNVKEYCIFCLILSSLYTFFVTV